MITWSDLYNPIQTPFRHSNLLPSTRVTESFPVEVHEMNQGFEI